MSDHSRISIITTKRTESSQKNRVRGSFGNAPSPACSSVFSFKRRERSLFIFTFRSILEHLAVPKGLSGGTGAEGRMILPRFWWFSQKPREKRQFRSTENQYRSFSFSLLFTLEAFISVVKAEKGKNDQIFSKFDPLYATFYNF